MSPNVRTQISLSTQIPQYHFSIRSLVPIQIELFGDLDEPLQSHWVALTGYVRFATAPIRNTHFVGSEDGEIIGVWRR